MYNVPITGDGTYKFQFSDLPVGIRSLKVNYSGYSFNPALTSNVLAHEVKVYDTTPVTLTLTASAAEVTTQDSVQLKATFGSEMHYGAIEWFDNGVLAFRSELGSYPPVPMTAFLTVATAGVHNFQAKFTGSGWGAPASSNVVAVTARNDRTLSRLFIASPIDGSRLAATSSYGAVPVVINGFVPAGDRVSFMWLTRSVNGQAEPERQVCGPNETYTSNSCSVLVPGGFSFTVPFTILNNSVPGTYTLQAKIQYGQAPVMLTPPVTVSVVRASGAGETTTYLHTDFSGSPIAATNQAGALLWREGYRPYGLRALKEPASSKNRQFFHGKPEDPETGFSYFGARYYDPLIGRFLGVDPQGFDEKSVHSFNRFAYGNLNPNKYVDPDGRMWQFALLLFGWWVTDTANGDGPVTPPGGQAAKGGAKVLGEAIAKAEKSAATTLAKEAAGAEAKIAAQEASTAAKATTPYTRPSGATTAAQRESVQGKPCVKCGAETPKQVAGHKEALVKEHYETGKIDKQRMRSNDAVQPECPTCSAREGADMSRYSREMKKELGL